MARKFNKNIKLLNDLHAKQGNEGFQITKAFKTLTNRQITLLLDKIHVT